MNRIDKLFSEKKDILTIYFTAGYPNINDTLNVIAHLTKNQVDMIEIGIPFSDPLADGETIQKSSQQALENGITLAKIFEQLKNVREITNIPLLFMGYFNPVLKYGVKAFCKKCKVTGIDGLIIPDLPLDVFIEEYKHIFDSYGLYNINLISPETSDERIKYIDKHSKGFIYMVSSSSTTGKSNDITDEQKAYFERINKMKLTNPQLIGFGISDRKSFDNACAYSSGAIIGSAFIKIISNEKNLKESIDKFISGIKNN